MKRYLKHIIFSCFLLTLLLNLQAQQVPHYTQYIFNTQLYNPAYVGSKEFLSLTLSSRIQWTPINGAPQTHNIFAQTKLENRPIGIGASFSLDRLGPVDQKDLSIDGSYTIRATEKSQLAFGLKIGGEILTIDLRKGDPQDPGDPLLSEPIESKFSPTLGAGAFWYGDNWYMGLSLLNLLHTNHFGGEITDRPHYFLMSGYVFELSKMLKFKPTLLTKVVSGAPLSLNVAANIMFDEKFTGGLSYNNGESLSVAVSADLSSVFTIGYSFDYSLKSLNQFNDGSHEFVLSYRFTESSKAHRCHTRFF